MVETGHKEGKITANWSSADAATDLFLLPAIATGLRWFDLWVPDEP